MSKDENLKFKAFFQEIFSKIVVKKKYIYNDGKMKKKIEMKKQQAWEILFGFFFYSNKNTKFCKAINQQPHMSYNNIFPLTFISIMYSPTQILSHKIFQ